MDLSQVKGRSADYAHRAWAPRWLQDRPKPIRIAVRSVAIVILLLFLIWLILFVTKGRFLKGPFESIATTMSERQVDVGGDFQLYFAPFRIKFRAEDLSISNPEWAGDQPFFKAGLIDSRIAPLSLLFGKKRVHWLELADSTIDLRWNKDAVRNNWTFGNPDDPGEPLEIPVIERARIVMTHLEYRDPKLQLITQIDFETTEARGSTFDQAIRFAGRGRMRARPFTVSGRLLSPNETAAGGANRLELAGRAGATELDISGTLPGATQLEGSALKIEARGPNLAFLFDFIGVAVPESRTYRISSDLGYTDEIWHFTDMKGVVGDSDLAGRMDVSLPNDRLRIDGAFATQTLDILDAGPFIGYNPRRLDELGASGTIRTVNGAPRLLPDAPLRIDAVQRFDAHLDWTVKNVRAESLPLSDIALTFDLDRGNMRINPFTMNVAGGTLSSDIAINARTLPVNSSFDVTLSPTNMGVLLAKFGVEESGTSGTMGGRLQLKGVGDSLRETLSTSNGRVAMILPEGTFWTRNAQLAELDIGVFVQKMFEDELEEPVQINCGLIGFTVRDGVAAADPVLIDTEKNVILGRGGFSFRTEALDMAIRADGRKFSLFSGQSPIGLDGYFAEPSIDPISGELAARAGAGIGLAAVATPLAGILAFVDIGDAKSADCGPVLSGARASAQRTSKGKERDDVGKGTTAKSEDGKASEEERKQQRDTFLKGKKTG